jgi:beta-lactamase regulating signal transducer with metallopeptidase domain
MNVIGWALFWMSVPITIVAAAALVLERIASRRGPVSGSWVSAASLLVIVVLTPVAICGLPQRWSWRIPPSNSQVRTVWGVSSEPSSVSSSLAASSIADTWPADLDEARGGLVRSGAWWRRFFDGASREMSSIRKGSSSFPTAWAILVLSGTGCCLASLLLGLWGVRDCRRRSVAIGDPNLRAEVESLCRSLSVAGHVEVRELSSAAGSTAAAAGWLRPFILFPHDWRSWSSLERRAVLAHELAHVARADYASGIVAQLGLALHFYHPLIHWMVARLRLQQELAADALGAPLVGGCHSYVFALSRMALRPEEEPLAWPARTFLRSGGHLIRRIQMLRERLQGHDRSLSVATRVVVVALLTGVGASAVAFRGVSPARAAGTPAVTAATTESISQRFDLSYISPDAVGVCAIRPAAISRIPGLKSHFDKLTAQMAKAEAIGLPKLEMIEQAAIEFSVLPRDRSKKMPGRLLTGDWMVRSVEDFDWKSLATVLLKTVGRKPEELVEVRLDDHVYYKAVRSPLLGPHACLYFPDARTIVCSFHEDQLRERIRRGANEQLKFLHGDDWRQVDRGLMAVAINECWERWKLDVSEEDPEDLPIAPLLQQASRWVVGVDASDVLKLHAIATCSDEAKGEVVARIAKERMALAQVALDGPVNAGSPEKDREVKALIRAAKDLMQACQIRRDGAVVDLSAERKVESEALAAVFSELAF